MSGDLIGRSSDLRLLVEQGYQVEIRSAHLILHRIPYAARDRTVKYGALVAPLTLRGGSTAPPERSSVYFIGEYPCYEDGEWLEQIRMEDEPVEVAEGLWVDREFSAYPHHGGYRDYHHQMTVYSQILGRPARRLDPGAAPRSAKLAARRPDDDPFRYLDTASSRAGITRLAESFTTDRIGIVGLGGTGSYILDYVSKTRVAEIHLFDGDRFEQHNAFRAPGGASLGEIEAHRHKVDLLAERYSLMRGGIVAHPEHVTPRTLPLLTGLDFLFVSIDDDGAKQWLFPSLQEQGVPFVDVGMGLERADGKLLGMLRTSLSTETGRCHEPEMRRVRNSNGPAPDDGTYDRNIQIAELNALNAAYAVIRWKKYRGFYADLTGELQSIYTLDGNHLLNSG